MPTAGVLLSGFSSASSTVRRDIPPISCFGDARTCDFPCEAQFFRQIDPSEFGDPELQITKLELIIRKVKARLASLLAFEFRTTFSFPRLASFKKVREGFAQVKKGLIRSVFRDFPRKGEIVHA